VNVTVLYVGSSLLAPLRNAEREIEREYRLGLRIATHNFGAPLTAADWEHISGDLQEADVVFVIHVLDGENAARLLRELEEPGRRRAVVVINCMPDLMRRTQMGRLDFRRLAGSVAANPRSVGRRGDKTDRRQSTALHLVGSVGSWVGKQVASHRAGKGPKGANHKHYTKLAGRLPALLRFVPATGALRDVKHYLSIFCYFLQPTPTNIRVMILYALRHYVPDERLRNVKLPPPEQLPVVAIYHPDATELFASFAAYRKWYEHRARASESEPLLLKPSQTIGLLLMRPQVISEARQHYDELIHRIEAEGLSVMPVLSTLMDNREACQRFFLERSKPNRAASKTSNGAQSEGQRPRISQMLSLTGFSFVGGPAMNDGEAAVAFLRELNRPYRSAVSLDMQTVESWRESQLGLNPVQSAMQVAIPEIDGATEPFIYGGIPAQGNEPVPLAERCERLARRLKRWHRLQTAERGELKIALVLYCFPPGKGNIGTAADLDVFPSLYGLLQELKADGYRVDVPESAEQLREALIGENAELTGSVASIAYRMTVAQYRRWCPYVDEIEKDWGTAPGRINSFAGELLIQGVTLGNVFVGVQPTFGLEGDPMRLMMARSASPHHGFMGFYTYLARVFQADVAIHVGTHGAMEFMPGKQVGLSGECWPDRLIGELPNIYLYSVNNPAEGAIAKRRSYAELISYLTPPIENAGLYKDLASLKDLVMAYRMTEREDERARLFQAIEEVRLAANL
jgi:magnesium chelatase subunit H